ncbi:MAG: pyruvate kinase [Dehalococcoidia bacterium]|nr:pyruvate kinase [Dehalococcoidia bacterium]MDD5494717.1 pyruvate kinase [Dehalococcoidia bacterium]
MSEYERQSATLRKTKIVCTIGPSSNSSAVLKSLLQAGMNVARINASHGTMEEHGEYVEILRREAVKAKVPLAILLDLPGPKDRTGKVKKGGVKLREGMEYVLTTRDVLGNESQVSVDLPDLPRHVKLGQAIFLDDGLIKLEVASISTDSVRCKVITGGRLGDNKGVSVPGVTWDTDAVTEEDWKHLEFVVKLGIDFVGLSFVSKAEDVMKVKDFLQQQGSATKVIAKIERVEGLNNFDEILETADGVMVARGDLGVQIPIQKVPVVQKELIRKCNHAGKPVIVATQMLESMVDSPVPTRAEATDVANAIFDGADAIMLSEETAIGNYAVETAKMMSLIAMEAEAALPYEETFANKAKYLQPLTDDAISYAACHTAHQLGAKAVVAYTSSGSTARRVSKYRPQTPILAITPDGETQRQLSLSWGVYAVRVSEAKSIINMFKQAAVAVRKFGLAEDGDLVVVTGGIPIGIPGTTNMLKVEKL